MLEREPVGQIDYDLLGTAFTDVVDNLHDPERSASDGVCHRAGPGQLGSMTWTSPRALRALSSASPMLRASMTTTAAVPFGRRSRSSKGRRGACVRVRVVVDTVEL